MSFRLYNSMKVDQNSSDILFFLFFDFFACCTYFILFIKLYCRMVFFNLWVIFCFVLKTTSTFKTNNHCNRLWSSTNKLHTSWYTNKYGRARCSLRINELSLLMDTRLFVPPMSPTYLKASMCCDAHNTHMCMTTHPHCKWSYRTSILQVVLHIIEPQGTTRKKVYTYTTTHSSDICSLEIDKASIYSLVSRDTRHSWKVISSLR